MCIQILLGNELLDLVNGDSLVDGSSGTGVLTAAVADAAADSGQGMLGILYLLAVLGAQFLTQLDRTGRTDFYALADPVNQGYLDLGFCSWYPS